MSPIGWLVNKLQLFKRSSCCKFSKQMKKSEFRVLINHCFLMGKITVQAKKWLDKCYSDSAPSETMVRRWYALNAIILTQMILNSQVTQIRQLFRKTPNNKQKKTKQNKFHKLILADRKLRLHEIAEGLKISEGSVFSILHKHFQWESCVQSGSRFCLQSIKNNNASTIQSVVCNF